MKIGIDASRLTRKDRTGTENYLYYLVKEFSRLNSDHEFILYFVEEPDTVFWSDLINDNSKFSFKVLKKLGSWTQVSLSLELFLNPIGVLFCPWHTLPILHPFWSTKIVATIHDTTGKYAPLIWTICLANRLIAVSESTKFALSAHSLNKRKNIHIIHEGFDSGMFRGESKEAIDTVRQKYNITNEYILFLGSISDRKNIENMVQAFNNIESNLEFVLGGGVLSGYEYLTKLDARFIGRVDQTDLPALYSGAKFFAFVSKEEGFGIPILEAMACGIPVLTSNISATKEVAGDAALLVDPNSIEDISNGMKKLFDDESLRFSLIEKGYERVKNFSWEKAAKETLKVFEEVRNED